MEAFYAFLLRHPRWWLGAVVVTTLLLAVPASRLRFDSSVERLMLEADPDRVFFDRVREIFGNDEILVVVLADKETIFRTESLWKIKRISDRVQELEGVERVVSLTTVYNIRSTGQGIQLQRLVGEIPREPKALHALREEVLKNNLFRNMVVSEDGKSAAVNIFVENRPGEEGYRGEIIRTLQDFIAEEQGPESIHLAGVPYSEWTASRLMVRDMLKFSPLTVLLIALTLLFTFGSVRGVMIPLLTIGTATVWTVGLMSLVGKCITLLTTAIPALVMIVGSAYTIHVVAHYYDSVRQGITDPGGLAGCFKTISLPVTLTALTTTAGFVSITVNRVPAVRDFGVCGMLGILFCFLLSLTFVPACLVVFEAKPIGHCAVGEKGGGRWWLERLASFNVRRRKSIVTVSILLSLIGLAGIRHLRVETEYIAYLKEDEPVIQDLHWIEEHFAGTVLWNIVLDGGDEGVLKKPENVKAIGRFQAFLNQQAWIDKTVSYLDYLRWTYQALVGGPEGSVGLPDTREEISQCLLLYSLSDPDALDQLVNQEYSMANIIVRGKNTSSTVMRANVRTIEEQAKRILPAEIRAKMTGTGILMLKTADQIAVGQAKSLSIALVVIFFLLWLMFRSLKVSLVSMIPNMVPLGILFGLMGWVGITLNTATSLIASITLAIAVDDTIHYMTRFNNELKKTCREQDAMRNALIETGKPITSTTVALCLGFLVFCLSNFVPVIYIGSLAAMTFAICLLADIVLLPAVLLMKRVSQEGINVVGEGIVGSLGNADIYGRKGMGAFD